MPLLMLAEIGRYPVEGLGGEALGEAFLGLDGLRFDRLLGLANEVIPLESFGGWTSFEGFHHVVRDAENLPHRDELQEAAP
jgi:hypothetical protein